jgi:hypothetical protein
MRIDCDSSGCSLPLIDRNLYLLQFVLLEFLGVENACAFMKGDGSLGAIIIVLKLNTDVITGDSSNQSSHRPIVHECQAVHEYSYPLIFILTIVGAGLIVPDVSKKTSRN